MGRAYTCGNPALGDGVPARLGVAGYSMRLKVANSGTGIYCDRAVGSGLRSIARLGVTRLA